MSEVRVDACHGKQAFPTRNLAAQSLKRIIKRKRPPQGVRMAVYRCRYCGNWHVGTEQR